MNEPEIELSVCKKCGGPVPKDHDICWVCEHDPKLGYAHYLEKNCSDDSCKIDFQDNAKESLRI